jgi:hypothetical protein
MVSKTLISALVLSTLATAHGPSNHGRHHELAKKQESYGYMNVGYYVRLFSPPLDVRAD